MSDVLTEAFTLLRTQTALYALARIGGAWGVRFPAASGAYFHLIDGGDSWLDVDGVANGMQLASGDVVLLAHGSPHRLTRTPGGPIRVDFDPQTWRPNYVAVADDGSDDPGGGYTLVCGAVELSDVAANPLFAALPPIVHLPATNPAFAELSSTLAALSREKSSGALGSDVLLARLGDVLLMQVLRAWLEQQEPASGGWLGAIQDPQIGAAIAAIHAEPEAPWTVARLAARARLSRSRFAQRFSTAVGEPPLAYVLRWRMTVAAELLQAGERTAKDVGRVVGYTSEPAFSRAFTRFHGTPPGRYARTRPTPMSDAG
jgi:AraC-like DNA-binding protein